MRVMLGKLAEYLRKRCDSTSSGEKHAAPPRVYSAVALRDGLWQ
jgi:hypothetical protein